MASGEGIVEKRGRQTEREIERGGWRGSGLGCHSAVSYGVKPDEGTETRGKENGQRSDFYSLT